MGAQKGLLAALIALVCIYVPVFGEKGCSGFKHLDNGQTFFRYGGLLVIFRCHPGYKLHGYKTNSCVSGHWSRDPPVCVGSGCSNPGPLVHGRSRMNEDGSWVLFSCNSGFRLRGPSMLYCRGHTWNSTKPVCKESDMMSSYSSMGEEKSSTWQNLQISARPWSQQHSHFEFASTERSLRFDFLPQTSSNMFSSGRIYMTNPKAQLKNHTHFASSKPKHGVHTTQGSKRRSSEMKALLEEAGKSNKLTQMFALKYHLPTTVSSAMSLVSGTEGPTSPPSFSAAHTPAVTTFSNSPVRKNSLHQYTNVALPVIGFRAPVTSQDNLTPSEEEIAEKKVQQAKTGSQSAFMSLPLPLDKEKPTEISITSKSVPSFSDSSSSISSPAASAPLPSSNKFITATQLPDTVTLPSNISTIADSRTFYAEYHDLGMYATPKPFLPFLSLSRRPVCPYPPVPAHGTFSFRNLENPGPREFRHYIQYACYPGYTLAHGDIHSYCQQGGTWSGITPVCLELTPCSVNNGGCSQLCSHTQNYNQSSNQTRTQCLCKPGFVLLDDGQTCRDLDECAEGQNQCQQSCINTFGSFKCGCDVGYQPTPDQTSCTDVDECLLPAAVTGCTFDCINTPGSFHCQCLAGYSQQTTDGHCQDIDECAVNHGLGPCTQQCHNLPGSYRCSCTSGHILAGDGHSCFAECPAGYRKQPTTPPDNSTAQTLKEECVDINECLEEVCEFQCINLPGSHRCICPRGYTLLGDGRRCKDINECKPKNGGCSHLCVNKRGGYKCACPASHRLSSYSWKKCLPRTTANTAG